MSPQIASPGPTLSRLLIPGFLGTLFLVACASPPAERIETSGPEKKDYSKPLPPGARALEKLEDPAHYPDFAEDPIDRESLRNAVARSLDYLDKPSSRKHFPIEGFEHGEVRLSLERFAQLLETHRDRVSLARAVAREFDVYRSVGWDGRGTVLFTGYCQPIYDASLTRTGLYRYPLYKLPPDLVKDEEGECVGRRLEDGSIEPGYPTRRQIEEQGLLDGHELVYLKDPFEAYVVHVQGSAKLRLPDGEMISVGYAGKTSHPYTSVGEALIRDGRLPEGQRSLAGMRRFFRENPGEVDRYLHQNDRYIFFTRNEGGPYGSLGQAVTSHRTIATDKSIFPRAALCFVDTRVPEVTSTGRVAQRPLRAFVLDQDTGGAIRSPGRCDLFLGTGDDAERIAGFTYAEGKLYYLFLKERVELGD